MSTCLQADNIDSESYEVELSKLFEKNVEDETKPGQC